MTIKDMPIYLCVVTEKWQKKIVEKGSVANHKFGEINNRIIVWPKTIDSETINPRNLIKLKKQLKLEELLIIDRLAGTEGVVFIINHVNRSGQNFLRGNTPEGESPQFPDMSKIYNEINDLDSVVVHTISGKRFQNPPIEENVIWSEFVGLIAPVAHYVGIKVFAIGGNNFDDINKIL